MLIREAQRDLSRAYVGGGPGIVISGIVWLGAGLVERAVGVAMGFVTLFLGGMAIFPVATIVCRLMFRRANAMPDNPFGRAVLESTIAMIGGLFAAWLFLATRAALVFPLAAIAVGTHYFVFRTVYGDRWFWLLAAIVTAIGVGGIVLAPGFGSTALLVALTELGFGAALTAKALRRVDGPVQASR